MSKLTLLLSAVLICSPIVSWAGEKDYKTDPHYTSPAESLSKFFSGTWEGSANIGLAIPDSNAQLDNSYLFNVGIYHDFGSNMAVELQYFTSGDFDSDISSNAQLQTDGFIASLRGYGKPSPSDLVYFGRLGAAFWDAELTNGSLGTSDDSGVNLVIGFGAEKKVSPKTTLSLELTHYQDIVQSGYVNSLSFGVRTVLFEK